MGQCVRSTIQSASSASRRAGAAERRERRARVDPQRFRALLGGRRGPGIETNVGLPCGDVLAGGLAERSRRAFDVEHVVDDLKREARGVRVGVERAASDPVSGRPQAAPRRTAARISAPVFIRCIVSSCDSASVDPDAVEVDRLPAGHAADAGRLGEHRAGSGAVGKAALGEHAERERLQRVAGEQRRRLAERDVARRLAAAQRVVVHAREVVVNERIGVDELDRGRRARRPRRDPPP